MDGYISNLLLKFVHEAPTKPQLSPHRHSKIIHGSKGKFTAEEDTSPKLTDAGIKRVQAIVGALLYYACAVNNRLLVGLSAIGDQHEVATEQTTAAIDQLLDHVATYPDDGIIYRDSDMILTAHSDAVFNNESKACIHTGSQIFLSEE